MLRSYRTGSKEFNFVTRCRASDQAENSYTIIVGKNGTGKSRLLRSIVTELIGDVVDRESLARDERISFTSDHKGILDFDWKPSQIICTSTSPFDKFPLFRRDHVVEGYSYLGLRGLPSSNMGLAYMGRIIQSLIEAADRSSSQAHAIAEVLRYLGYKGMIQIRLQFPMRRFAEELLSADDPTEVLKAYPRPPFGYGSDGLGVFKTLPYNDRDTFWRVVEVMRSLPASEYGSPVEVLIDESGVTFRSRMAIGRGELLLLARAGLLRMREVILQKNGIDRPLRLHEASSGEQAVVMGLLGIGSHIKDKALVCIDEPEVCLHPEWQERYIELLFNTFRGYYGCHFLIATHSPQIVAQIPDGNCYVMSMENGLARSAQDYARRSIDFQLAEVFNAPGFRNEYLTRIALNLFAKASKEKRFDESNLHELRVLRGLSDVLQDNDPLKELIYALEQMVKAYE